MGTKPVSALQRLRRTAERFARIGAVGVLVALTGCGAKAQTAAQQFDFNEQIRPLLSDKCFRCHGPDAETRKADLRLDLPGPAYAALPKDVGKHAIVPGKPEQSELIRRISSTDPSERMPKDKDPLSAAQIALLTDWIKAGAPYKPLWSLIPPAAAPVPSTPFDAQAVNAIDHFVFARVQKAGVIPAPQADRATLINRVSLTLTGLPPSLEDVDRFVADPDPNAYEKLVDRLLASDAYGERMAGEWMNVARWADSDGYLDDAHDRFLWPWRDWVISAFTRNMPYDQFASWQLAGDLLPQPTREQLLATAFLRIGQRNTENGAINEQYRIESVVDKTNTVGTAFLGLTVGCARCHDHKYDPISQKDFYSLSGFFNSLDEPGVYTPGFSGIQDGPTLPWPTPSQQQQITQAEQTLRQSNDAFQASLGGALRAVQPQLASLLSGAAHAVKVSTGVGPGPATPALWQLLDHSIQQDLVAYYPFDSLSPIPDTAGAMFEVQPGIPLPPELMIQFDPGKDADVTDESQAKNALAKKKLIPKDAQFSGSGTAKVGPAVLIEPKLGPGVHGQALYITDSNSAYLARGVGHYDRTQPFSIDFWFYPAQRYADSTPIFEHSTVKNSDDPDSGNAGYELRLAQQHLVFYMSHSRPHNMIELQSDATLPLKHWVHLTLTYDGSSRAAGVQLYADGKALSAHVIRDNLSEGILPDAYQVPLDDFKGIMFGSRFREKSAIDSAIDEFRVFDQALIPLQVAYLHGGEAGLDLHSPTNTQQLALLLALHTPEVVAARRTLDTARDQENKLVSGVPEVLIMGDTKNVRTTYRLNRGVYDQPREQVPVQGLAQVFAWTSKYPPNRTGLAQWLFDRNNPLTARVFVNRLWQMHFGVGLVKTAEDFGSQGSPPTNQALLDWLAVQFMQSGWDIKRLQKLIVMSYTYRQRSAASEALLQKDPENALLARGPRFRMPGAMMRDNALAVSGLLVHTVGGPSVFPYQPEGVWNNQNDLYSYPRAKSADDEHRRSLYTFIKRNAPNPDLQLLDSADPDLSTPRLRTSNTPLQALLLLNDPQYQEAYRIMAAHALAATHEPVGQLTLLFRLARRQSPSALQLHVIDTFYRDKLVRYRTDPAAAQQRIRIGVAPIAHDTAKPELAALTDVATLIMAAPDSYFIQ